MSDFRFRLSIPPGKKEYTLLEAVEATALAMHPQPGPEEPVVILSIDKVPFIDGDPAKPSRPEPLEDADWQTLRAIWLDLEPPVLPMPASSWRTYAEAFDASLIRPPWGLTALRRDPAFQSSVARIATMADHQKLLRTAIRRGELTPRNAMSGAPEPNASPNDRQILSLSDFKTFCRMLLIEAVPIQTFTVSARPECVDAALLALDPNDMVEVRDSIGNYRSVRNCRARDYISQIRETIKEQAEGYFRVAYAAQILADAYPAIDPKDMIRRMAVATVNGRRLVRDPWSRLPIERDSDFREFLSVVKVSELDAWLEAEGVEYRFSPALSHPTDVALYAGGITWVDQEYDERLQSLHPETQGEAHSSAKGGLASSTGLEREELTEHSGLPPMPTPNLADAFDGVVDQSAQQWREKLGDVNNHQWLLPALASRGKAPNPSTWWPLAFADLLEKRGATPESLNRKFLYETALKPWLPLWQKARRQRNAFGQ